MKHLALCLGLTLLLGACSGSPGTPLPTLLAVSLVESGAAQVALVETTLTVGGAYTLLEESRRDLAAPAVDFDVTDRNGGRDTLLVLSWGNDNEGYLDSFSLQGIDPGNPVAFAPVVGKPRLALSSLANAPADGFCPEAVQISRDGRYAAVLNGTRCGNLLESAIDIIDLKEKRVLTRLDSFFGLVDAPPYLDQQNNLLYYLEQGVSDATLIRLSLPDLTEETLVTLPDQDQVDLGQAATNLLILRPSEVTALPLSASAETTELPTRPGARRFIDSYASSNTAVLVLGNNHLTVYRSLEDGKAYRATVEAQYGTLDDNDGFAYFATAGRIIRFDLLNYQRDSSLPLLREFAVPELSEPGPITNPIGVPLAASAP